MISNVNDLSARLWHRTETEGRKMDEIAERELRAFGETLSGGAKHKLHIFTAAMEDEIGRIHGLLRRAWLRPLVTSLVVGLRPNGCSLDSNNPPKQPREPPHGGSGYFLLTNPM